MTGPVHRRSVLKFTSLLAAGLALPKAELFAHTAVTTPLDEGPLRLASNENPYGPSPSARKAMAEAITQSNRYQWEITTKLREHLGTSHNLSKDYVLMGAGSSEILSLVSQLTVLNKGNAITAAPSFSIWIPAAEKLGLSIIKVPLTEDKKFNLQAMLGQLNENTRLFYICNPNNPTGTLLPAAAITQAAEEASKKALVVIDEAYLEYTDEPSQVNLVKNNKNIIIVKTFSKIYGLAGARIGYAIAHPDIIQRLTALQLWTNSSVSAVSAAAALASIQDKDFLLHSKTKNIAAKTYTQKELTNLGFKVIPSQTNFIYYSLANYNGDWQGTLKAKNILTGRIVEERGKWTRTTIGTLNEMQQFITAVKTII